MVSYNQHGVATNDKPGKTPALGSGAPSAVQPTLASLTIGRLALVVVVSMRRRRRRTTLASLRRDDELAVEIFGSQVGGSSEAWTAPGAHDSCALPMSRPASYRCAVLDAPGDGPARDGIPPVFGPVPALHLAVKKSILTQFGVRMDLG